MRARLDSSDQEQVWVVGSRSAVVYLLPVSALNAYGERHNRYSAQIQARCRGANPYRRLVHGPPKRVRRGAAVSLHWPRMYTSGRYCAHDPGTPGTLASVGMMR
jgi:hypothetical protein